MSDPIPPLAATSAVPRAEAGRLDEVPPPEPRAAPPLLLVLRALGLGDLLTSVPAMRGLRRRWPDHRLVLAAPAPIGAYAVRLGLADDVLVSSQLQSLAWEGPGPDVAVDLHGCGPASHHLLLATRPGRLVAWATPSLPDHHGPGWDPDEHEVRRWCRLVTATGLRTDPLDLLVAPPPGRSAADGAVVLHPGAAFAARRWPPDRFAAVGRALRRDGHRVVLTGSATEAALCSDVAARAGLNRHDVLAGRLGLVALTRLVADARIVICGDTGVGHLATACGTPAVHLFGPEPPSRWGPLVHPDRHAVLWHGDGTGDPHGAELDPALARIGVDEVLAAAATLLDRHRVDDRLHPPRRADAVPSAPAVWC